jgi:hypothetical protein
MHPPPTSSGWPETETLRPSQRGGATRDKEDGGGMVTILDKVDQPLWSSNGDACIVLLEKRDLLFNLEVLGELQTR